MFNLRNVAKQIKHIKYTKQIDLFNCGQFDRPDIILILSMLHIKLMNAKQNNMFEMCYVFSPISHIKHICLVGSQV